VKESHLKSLFQQYSRQRTEMARELQSEVRRLGGDPEKAGSMAGAAHRGWMNIKSAVSRNDDQSIIAEAERGEDYQPLPPQTLALVREQSMKVHDAHDRVRALEKATSR
jgi:uncharacterized protein (TIGR02284 family)